MRRVLELLLSDQWEVQSVEDGRSALRATRSRPPHLAVVDLLIPHLDGLALLREIRADVRTRQIPVIMISGVTEEEPRIKALEAGANDFLVKPFSERELIVKMKAQLESATLRAAEIAVEDREAVDEASLRAGFLAEAGRIFSSTLDHEHTMAAVAQLAVPTVADWCAVHLRSDDGGTRRLAFAAENRAAALSTPDPPAGVETVIRTGQAELYADGPDRWAMAAPIVARGRILGALSFGTAESGRPYRREDLAFAQSLADHAALAVDNARLYRQAQEANRIKDDFLATLSHELRTPLNAIVGWAHLLKTSPLDADDVRRAAETIDRNARIQSQLIGDVLDVSRIAAGKLRMEVRPVDLGPVLEAALESVRPSARAKGIGITTNLDPAVGPVWGDADRFQQVFWNLLSNAVKFTPAAGEIRIRLARSGTHVETVVEDTGIGMDAEFLLHVFERFRQADCSTTRRHGGLGLGLSIARHLVERQGGTLTASSPGPGRGATFTVSVPLLIESDPAPSPPVEPDSPLPSIEGVRILVVDDDADTRELLAAVLTPHGARVHTVSSVAEALAAVEREPPDVLLADIEMPEQSGYDLIRRLRDLPPERGGRIAAAALTAYARPQDRVEALRAGFQVHMAKPVDPRALVRVVASLTEGHRPRR